MEPGRIPGLVRRKTLQPELFVPKEVRATAKDVHRPALSAEDGSMYNAMDARGTDRFDTSGRRSPCENDGGDFQRRYGTNPKSRAKQEERKARETVRRFRHEADVFHKTMFGKPVTQDRKKKRKVGHVAENKRIK